MTTQFRTVNFVFCSKSGASLLSKTVKWSKYDLLWPNGKSKLHLVNISRSYETSWHQTSIIDHAERERRWEIPVLLELKMPGLIGQLWSGFNWLLRNEVRLLLSNFCVALQQGRTPVLPFTTSDLLRKLSYFANLELLWIFPAWIMKKAIQLNHNLMQ